MPIVTSATKSVPLNHRHERSWQDALKAAVRDPVRLCEMLQLPPELHAAAIQAADRFPLFVPQEYIARMRVADPHDPLLRQVLPVEEELQDVPGFTEDPVDDRGAMIRPGLLEKYAHRALMVTTPTCAVHCRYCFRRHYPYTDSPRTLDAWSPALAELSADASIEEIVLSGGDPLSLPDRPLASLVERLETIRHLRRLRLHTRLPVVIPQRITSPLVDLLRSTRLTTIVVIHANHPAELDRSVGQSVARLVDVGIPTLNQAVLLRGVNDHADTLIQLCRRLIDLRVLPYYLHQLDPVAGAAHFHVPVTRGRALVEELRRQLPGYAVPRYVREEPGQPNKTVLV